MNLGGENTVRSDLSFLVGLRAGSVVAHEVNVPVGSVSPERHCLLGFCDEQVQS